MPEQRIARLLIPRSFLTTLLLGPLFLAAPVLASFGDCNDDDYIARFDPRLSADTGFLCVESERVPVRSDAGTTHIRLIQHLVADWATRPDALRAIKEGVAASALAMARLGSFEISDVTILLVDGFAPDVTKENFGAIAAYTRMSLDDECLVTLWLLGPGATEEAGAGVVAHELFHCVQRSSLSAAQTASGGEIGSTGASGSWWLEGSAEWFSTLAVPAPAYIPGRVAAFDRDSPTVELDHMTYEAFPFFAWLAGAHGSEAVMPFLHAMAPSDDEGAQRTAMAAALSAEQWLRFAEDYLDQRIRDGRGAAIGSTPQGGLLYDWDATRTQTIELQPFVLARADLNVQCGHWRFAPTPATFHAARPADEPEWGALPASLDATSGERLFRFAGMATSASEVSLRVAGTREGSCADCGGSREIDRCLVGTWELTTHGAEQWLRQRAEPIRGVETRRASNTLTLREDGSFITGAARVAAEVRTDDMSARGRMVGQTSGRWSAASGHFNVCQEATQLTGDVTIDIGGRSVTAPARPGTPRDSSQPYVCTDTSLRVTMSMGGVGTVESIYTKVPTPP